MWKKNLLMADRNELYDRDVRDQTKDISVRLQYLMMKEYADANSYSM